MEVVTLRFRSQLLVIREAAFGPEEWPALQSAVETACRAVGKSIEHTTPAICRIELQIRSCWSAGDRYRCRVAARPLVRCSVGAAGSLAASLAFYWVCLTVTAPGIRVGAAVGSAVFLAMCMPLLLRVLTLPLYMVLTPLHVAVRAIAGRIVIPWDDVSSIAVATDEDLRSCIVTLRSPTKRIRMEEKGSDATSRSPLKDAIEASCQAAGKAIEFCGRQD